MPFHAQKVERRMKNLRTKAVAGIIVTLFLTTMFLTAVPVKSANIGTLKIGVIGPVGLPHWSPAGMRDAAEMARDEINALGGIQFPSGEVDIALEFGNEWALPVPDPDAAKWETLRLIAAGCHVIMGGFRTEVTTAILETCMDYKVPFIINGAFTSELISQTVPINYARYKYLFRTNPVNLTVLMRTIFAFLWFQAACKLLNVYGDPAYGGQLGPYNVPTRVPYAVLTENLAWTTEMYFASTDPTRYPYYLGPYFKMVYAARIPETATNLATYLNGVKASGARVIIHSFSGPVSQRLSVQLKDMGIKAIPVGINLFAQLYGQWGGKRGYGRWGETGRKCEYETILSYGSRESMVTWRAIQFWDNFYENTSTWPMYTAWGAYDTIYGLKDFVEGSGMTWAEFQDPDQFAAGYENLVRTNINGEIFKFTSTHDVYSPVFLPYVPTSYVRPRLLQWQRDPTTPRNGILKVVSPITEIYSQKWKLLPWSYPPGYESLAETDTTALPYPAYNWTIDGKVDLGDIMWIVAAWLTKPGDAGWNFNADLNDDDFINVVDRNRIAKDWGKTVPGGYPL